MTFLLGQKELIQDKPEIPYHKRPEAYEQKIDWLIEYLTKENETLVEEWSKQSGKYEYILCGKEHATREILKIIKRKFNRD